MKNSISTYIFPGIIMVLLYHMIIRFLCAILLYCIIQYYILGHLLTFSEIIKISLSILLQLYIRKYNTFDG